MAKNLDVSVILGSNDFYDVFNKDSILSRDMEKETMIKASKGDKKAQNLLVTANLNYARYCANKQTFSNLDYDDLLEECILGLVKASQNVQEKYCNQKFITYAHYYILDSICNAMCNNANYKISNVKFRMLKKVVSIYNKLSVELDSAEECEKKIALFLNISEEDVHCYLILSQKLISLERTQVSKDDVESVQLSEMIRDDKNKTPEEDCINNLKNETFNKLINSLSEKEKKIFTMHYGLNGNKVVSMTNIGKEYGISRQNVYRIENKAKKYLCDNYKNDLDFLIA